MKKRRTKKRIKQIKGYVDSLEIPYSPGIYAIVSAEGVYVGQSGNLNLRLQSHLLEAWVNQHANYRLQNLLNVYDNWTFRILEDYHRPKDKALSHLLLRREAYWMAKLTPSLNIAPAEELPFDGKNSQYFVSSLSRNKWKYLSQLKEVEGHIEGKAKLLHRAEHVMEKNQKERDKRSARRDARISRISNWLAFLTAIFLLSMLSFSQLNFEQILARATVVSLASIFPFRLMLDSFLPDTPQLNPNAVSDLISSRNELNRLKKRKSALQSQIEIYETRIATEKELLGQFRAHIKGVYGYQN